MNRSAPITELEEALREIDLFVEPSRRTCIEVSQELLDVAGVNLAVMTDRALANGWEPAGVEEDDGVRVLYYRPVRGIATRRDGETWPLPFLRAEIGYRESYDRKAFDRIQRGLIPQNMDDKWLIFFEEPWLYMHRRTGVCVFMLRFEETPHGARVVESWANRKDEEFQGEKNEDRVFVKFLIEGLLLGRRAKFPGFPVEFDRAPVFRRVVDQTMSLLRGLPSRLRASLVWLRKRLGAMSHARHDSGITSAEAEEIVERRFAEERSDTTRPVVTVEKLTVEKPYGWIVFHRRIPPSADHAVVVLHDGTAHSIGTGQPDQVERFEKALEFVYGPAGPGRSSLRRARMIAGHEQARASDRQLLTESRIHTNLESGNIVELRFGGIDDRSRAEEMKRFIEHALAEHEPIAGALIDLLDYEYEFGNHISVLLETMYDARTREIRPACFIATGTTAISLSRYFHESGLVDAFRFRILTDREEALDWLLREIDGG